MRPLKYVLEGHTPLPVEDLEVWGRWIAENRAVRSVARTELGQVVVSTVFLGLDHSFDPDGQPILFETMIFGGKYDGFLTRYATWEEAEHGHQQAVELVEG